MKPQFPDSISERFKKIYRKSPNVIIRAPGRVNLLGEHVDYNEGCVLPAAIDLEVTLAARPTADEIVSIASLDLDAQTSFHLSHLEDRKDISNYSIPDWGLYPAGVAWSLQKANLNVQGAQITFTSNIPIGAGLSSSAAIEVGFAMIWQTFGGWKTPAMELAKICQYAENEFIGVACGLMDQFACLFGVPGYALFLDTRSSGWEPVPLPTDTSIVIADSGTRRSLSNSEYNARRASCEKALEELREYLPDIRSLRDVQPIEFAAYSSYVSKEPRMRAEHVVKEIARVQSALQALKRNDRQAFGALMFAGHASLRDLYEVSSYELDTLVDIARTLPGIIGSRLTGAGFGGCTVNLVEKIKVKQFVELLILSYKDATNLDAQVYECNASRGASILMEK